MCVVSAISDDWTKRFPTTYPWAPDPLKLPPWKLPQPTAYPPSVPDLTPFAPEVSREDFDKLRKDVDELKKLLLAAKRYDEQTGQPDCEIEEKVVLIKKIASLVGVDLDEVFGK